jgi:hypothetical protein
MLIPIPLVSFVLRMKQRYFAHKLVPTGANYLHGKMSVEDED